MNIKELAEKVTAKHPKIPGDIAMQSLRAAFDLLKKEIEATPDGVVTLATFGNFRSKSVTDKNGAPTVRRIFTPAKPRPAAGEGEG